MNGLGRNETHQNMRESRLWMRDTNFLEKNDGAIGVKKKPLFLTNICFGVSLHVFLELL
jgi:hypothetical protein